MKQREEDMVLGKKKEGEEPNDDMTVEDIIANIDAAQATYDFIDGIDLQGPEVLTWGLRGELEDAKRKCLEIIISHINVLHAL
jgi:hypothetical protein